MLNITTYWSSNVYNNTINIGNLFQFQVIIFQSGFQMYEQVRMHIIIIHMRSLF